MAELRDAGLLTIGAAAEGRMTWTLTPEGAQMARQMAMSSEDGAARAEHRALLDGQSQEEAALALS